jgi:hypothetical protein
MQEAVALMEHIPAASLLTVTTAPPATQTPARLSKLFPTTGEVLLDADETGWLQSIIDTWPRILLPLFVHASSIIAELLRRFGFSGEMATDLFAAALADPESMEMLMTAASLNREYEAQKHQKDLQGASDPVGMQRALLDEVQRREAARRCPFPRTLTTLLGHHALLWLLSTSERGVGNLQPHEFSRTGWDVLSQIENQLIIEKELSNLTPEIEHVAKIVVALAWTLAALGNLMPTEIFVGERVPHLTSFRQSTYTLSAGTATHTLIRFEPEAMLVLVRIMTDALMDRLLSAADLMWIGAALARVDEIRSGFAKPVSKKEERFSLFLSHRGLDAKRPLAEIVQGLPAEHGVFLDCMVLPHGVVNRSFIFGSLAHSEQILIVDTENFNDSPWCRKEAWFAEALAAHGVAKAERLLLGAAKTRVMSQGATSTRLRAVQGLGYSIAPRVLSDIDYWARKPNLYSLKEMGHPIGSLQRVMSALAAPPSPDVPAWVASLGTSVRDMLAKVVSLAPDGEPLDLWVTALQYSLAAFTCTSNGRSKVAVREGVDNLSAAAKGMMDSDLVRDPIFKAGAHHYLGIIAAAVAIQLAGYELDQRLTPALRITLGDAAAMRDGLILVDARQPGASRAFRLRLVALLIDFNIAGVGIVQDAADEIHSSHVGELPLEVLPCVTLYPGMESPFD